jgi:hypothetical protein
MAKNPDKAKDSKADKKAKAPKSAKSGAGAAKKSARSGAKPDLAAAPLTLIAKPPVGAASKASKKDKGAGKSANKKGSKSGKGRGLNLVPDLSLPSQGDVVETAKAIGGQIMSVLNTDAGRAIAAEVLIYLAKSLTKAATDTEAGKDATATMLNAGAKIGAAVASAGAQAMESGGDVTSAGAKAASAGAATAKDLAREVAQVAVSTVGGVAVDVAEKVLKRRGKSSGKQAGGGAPSGTNNPRPGMPA